MSLKDIQRVGLLTDGIFPFVTGGMQKHSYYLLRQLLERGIEVVLYHCAAEGESILTELSETHQLLLEEVLIPFPSSLKVPGSYLRDSKKYSELIAQDYLTKRPVDFIYAQGFTPWSLVEMKQKGVSLPVIGVNFHGLEMYQYAKGVKSKMIQRLFRPAVKSICEQADIVYSLGGKLTGILTAMVPESKVRVIPIGITEDWLRDASEITTSDRFRAAFIGRYERRKGIEELNKVMQTLEQLDIEYDFIGPIPEDKQLKRVGVTYHGKIMEEERIRAIFDAADILLVPSLAEGMPTVILEGMARGLAIVASDVGAVCEEVDAHNGRLIEAGNEDDLEKAIREMHSLPAHTLLAMKKASRQKVEEQFLWSHVIDLTIKQMNEDYL